MVDFTDEQLSVLDFVKEGYDVLVDACIGSGKTTVLQEACRVLKLAGKKVLYLTYNRRLLEEARKRIDPNDADVHTYHSFAGTMLNMAGVPATSEREVISKFNQHLKRVYKYDVIVVDEYQDISEELKDMLCKLCVMSNANYGLCPQFLVVGDKDQKIMDNTELDAVECMQKFFSFLSYTHQKEFKQIQFTNCFRLSADYATEIGQAWGKSIIGRNQNCNVVTKSLNECVKFLAQFEPHEILVLGGNMSWGNRIEIQNRLESMYPDKFNKDTVYSAISDRDGDRRNLDTSKCAVFTTYDTAKGMERRVCVICDFTQGYLDSRMKHQTSRKVLKNLFLVAASRGKEYNIMCSAGRAKMLSMKTIGKVDGMPDIDMRVESISGMFDYKLTESVDRCLKYIDVEVIQEKQEVINAVSHMGNIDLSLCAGIHAQAVYFDHYNLDLMIMNAFDERFSRDTYTDLPKYDNGWPLWKKILYLTALNTGQDRYFKQVNKEYITPEFEKLLCDRLSEQLDKDELVEQRCVMDYRGCKDSRTLRKLGEKLICGYADVVKYGVPWELKFVNELKSEHILQVASYTVCTDTDCGVLWNLKDNQILKITINDRKGFLEDVLLCISKGRLIAEKAGIISNQRDGALILELFNDVKEN